MNNAHVLIGNYQGWLHLGKCQLHALLDLLGRKNQVSAEDFMSYVDACARHARMFVSSFGLLA